MILKPQGAQRAIGVTANDVANAQLVYVVATAAANTLHFQYANASEYANLTVLNTMPVVVQKAPTDLLLGNGMFVVAVAYKG